jgi:hypothetical protein
MKKQLGAIDFSSLRKSIISIKGQNVLIDSDVAKIYGVETREVNQAIKNNPDKFPADYIIEADKDELIKIFDKFKICFRSPRATAATICYLHQYTANEAVRICTQGE